MSYSGLVQKPLSLSLIFVESKGWRRCLFAFGGGLLSSAALPPYYWVFLLWPAFAVLIWLIEGCERPRQAAWVGWFFGFGASLVGIHWVGYSFLVDAERFAALMPFAVAGLAAFLAFFVALTGYLTALSGAKGLARIAVFAAAWLFSDWVRSWLFTGFPWNFLGTIWGYSDTMVQLAAYGGVWSLTLVTLLASSSLALLGTKTGSRRVAIAAVLSMNALLAGAWLFGEWRLAGAPELATDGVEGERIRIVQPNIDQKQKWLPDLRRTHVITQMEMTLSPGFPDISQVVWAETAVPFLLDESPELMRGLAEAVPREGYLVTGAIRRDKGEDGAWRYYNSLHALGADGQIRASFDKFHLVPFGEYDPVSEFLPIGKLVSLPGSFYAGSGPRTLKIDGSPSFSPLICYEVIFPGAVTQGDGARPAWLLNVTNDAWFGTSSGPYQHLVNAKLRAVEEGLPLVRAANTGVSAVIDSYGRIIASLPLGARGVLDADLPSPLPVTLFGRLGNSVVAVLICALGLLAWWSWRFER